MNNPPALLAGSLPRRQHHLVLAWAELRFEELMVNWQLVEEELRLNKIDGLE